MSNMEEIRNFTYKVEEYEKQRKELRDCYEKVKEQDSRKTTLFLYGGCSSDLQLTLSDDMADYIVNSLCAWYDSKIKDFKGEINKCLTSYK